MEHLSLVDYNVHQALTTKHRTGLNNNKKTTRHQALVDYLNLSGRRTGDSFQVLDENIKAVESKAI